MGSQRPKGWHPGHAKLTVIISGLLNLRMCRQVLHEWHLPEHTALGILNREWHILSNAKCAQNIHDVNDISVAQPGASCYNQRNFEKVLEEQQSFF